MGKGFGRRRVLIAAVIVALVVIPAALVLLQQRAASASTILSILDGSASVARGAASFAAAADGDIVNIGDRVQTADRSHAIVTFFDGSTLEIEPATTVQIEDASSGASGAIAIRIAQTLGRTWATVQKLTRADSKFELRTPTLTAAVRGTGFITEVLADGTSAVQTIDGNVQVTGQGQSVSVGAGQTTTVSPNAPPTAPASNAAPANTLRFGLHSPAYLAVIDPFGRACGIVLPGPTVVRQIPGCLATDPGTDPQLVDVPNAQPGTYRVAIASIAPGGGFVATASAASAAGELLFNVTASGTGQPGARFASTIDVEVGPGGALSARGFGPLVATEQAAVRVVRAAPSPSIASGGPDPAVFAPLPRVGFTAGADLPATLPTAAPEATTAPLLTLVPSPTLSPSVTTLPTVSVPAIVPTAAPTALPTLIPSASPTPSPTLAPTPAPTPPPTPIAAPPTLSGGSASPGGTLSVLGTSWPAGAAITITWPDGTQIGSADVQTNGQFATVTRVPSSAIAGQTYRITAAGGGLVATADVVVRYTPTLTLLASFPPRAGASVPYSGSGWPASSDYSLSFDGVTIGGGVTTATGTFLAPAGATAGANPFFVVPANTAPGAHTVTVTSGLSSASASLTTQ